MRTFSGRPSWFSPRSWLPSRLRFPSRARFPSRPTDLIVRPRPAAIAARAEPLEPRALLSASALDPTFSGDGKVSSALGSAATFNAVLSLPDGKVLAAGTVQNGAKRGDFLVARYTAAGVLDTSFGGGTGRVFTDFGSTNDFGNALVLLDGGKFVVAGTAVSGSGGLTHSNFAVARYNANGTLDPSFSGDGKLTTDFDGQDDYAVGAALLSTGKLLVVGGTYSPYPAYDDYAIARYNTNGTLDTTFSGDGKVVSDFGTSGTGLFTRPGLQQPHALAVLPNDKFLVGGALDDCGDCGVNQFDFSLARYNANGTLDASFGGGDGWVQTDAGGRQDLAYAMAVQRDGKVVLAGTTGLEAPSDANVSESGVAVARYTADGALDTAAFGFGDGIVTFDLDTAHDPNTITYDLPRAVVVQPDDKILIAGQIRFQNPSAGFGYDSLFTARFAPGGGLDSYSTDGLQITSGLTSGNAMAFTAGGKAVIAGANGKQAGVVRFQADSPATASIAGLVFNDKDGDGVKDANEGVLSGWRVYIDSTPDGIYTPGEATVVTGADGKFKISGFAPGRYIVREVRQDGYVRTLPGGVYPLGYYDVSLAVGQAAVGRNFGNRVG